MDAQIVSDVRDRALGLKRQANPSLDQLLWVLPRSWHDRRLSSPADESTKRSLRRTRPGSTFASLMIAAGVNAKALSTYMGHAGIQITLDLYGHLMPGNESEAAAQLDAYLDRSENRP